MILQLPPTNLPSALQETTQHVIGHCARWLRGHVELLTVRKKAFFFLYFQIVFFSLYFYF